MRQLTHLCFIFTLFSVLATATAQPPAKKPGDKPPVPEGYPPETEETNPGPIKRRVIIEEEGPPPVTVPAFCYYARLPDLTRAATEVKNPALKALLNSYVIAFDKLNFTDGETMRVCPIPAFREGKIPQPFGVFPLNAANEPMKAVGIDKSRVRRIDHFEEILANEAAGLISPPGTNRSEAQQAPAAERALAAEHLMSAALLFYDTARDLSKRRGPGWDGVRAGTVAKLADARLHRLKLAAENRDWATVRSLGSRMVNLYSTDLKLLEGVFAARLQEAVLAANSDLLVDLERARELLVEFESRFPGSANPIAEEVRNALKAQKDKLFERARMAVKTENKEATRYIRTLEAIDPNYPGLRDLQSQLKGDYAVLMVGVSKMPRLMSPVTAFSDPDKMAVELLFESLVQATPHETRGVSYQPGLAASLPEVVRGGREIRLQRPVDWAGLPRQYADASDVAGTLTYYKGDYRGTWAAYPADWLDQPAISSQSSLRLGFQNGHPYPMALFDFKILPSRWLQANGLKPDDIKFSLAPFGTGPYKTLLGPDGRISTFIANPSYRNRPGHLGQPFLKEIRFVDVSKKIDLAAEFKTEQLHLIPDLPTSELAKFAVADPQLAARATVVTAPQPRRIWTLAVNHRKGVLNDVSLRRALAHAIDRERVLNETYRAGTNHHRVLNSPFPKESWAEPKAVTPLFDPNTAAAQFKAYYEASGKVNTELDLIVPADDPRAAQAAAKIAEQINNLSVLPMGKVTVTVRPLSAEAFEQAITRQPQYDLAYVPVDYPDDWYCFGLAAMLDPNAAGPHGRNLGGYLARQLNTSSEDQTLARNLDDIRRYADYDGKIQNKTHELHKNFLRAMPFIPLWQLDRHMVISPKLKIYFDGEGELIKPSMLPPSIFTQVQRWKLE